MMILISNVCASSASQQARARRGPGTVPTLSRRAARAGPGNPPAAPPASTPSPRLRRIRR